VRLDSLRKRSCEWRSSRCSSPTPCAPLPSGQAHATDDENPAACEHTGLWEILARVSPAGPLDYPLPRDVSQGCRRAAAPAGDHRALVLRPASCCSTSHDGLDNITLALVVRFLRQVSPA